MFVLSCSCPLSYFSLFFSYLNNQLYRNKLIISFSSKSTNEIEKPVKAPFQFLKTFTLVWCHFFLLSSSFSTSSFHMVGQRSKSHKARRSQHSISRHSRRVDERIPISSSSLVEKNLVENLDEETRVAKRHLTKEMWQLVSIAVKRMADELVTISNQQQTPIPPALPLPVTAQPTSNETIVPIETNDVAMQTTISKIMSNTIVPEFGGAGDIPVSQSKISTITKGVKKRTLSMQMLECSTKNKKKESSNNAIQRSNKSKKSKRSTKKLQKSIKHSPSSIHKQK